MGYTLCRYCNIEMVNESSTNDMSFYGFIEGRPPIMRSWERCPKCDTIYDNLRFHPSKKIELATDNQVKYLKYLTYRLREDRGYNYCDLYDDLVYGRTKEKICSKEEATYFIKILSQFETWEALKQSIERFYKENILNDYLRERFFIDDQAVADMLFKRIDFSGYEMDTKDESRKINI